MGDLYPTVPPAVIPGAARIIAPGPERERVADRQQDQGMDSLRELLDAARTHGLVPGRFRGLLHIAIGRTVTKPDGSKVSTGLTWRALAAMLKALRYDPELGREVGADPDTLSPRDRERYWYAVIGLAKVDAAEFWVVAERLVAPLKEAGFLVAPAAGSASPPAPVREKPKPTAKPKADKEDDKPKKKKK
jgi:hypothetical protein